ncbi:LptA/OstA family protein [Pleionea litopenaei]|uniref:Uncharacterized protein n=1 Tax=Pleionea litopenaei TaxID=3070815 RepID=A0AA51RT22_9GAMM|nr:LptA/OstA family protein [Pleionea sp. HL-JVS1]WMS87117.1 hypothetical protein Q9312_18070 [Pleionea sp. HL-JVS1]
MTTNNLLSPLIVGCLLFASTSPSYALKSCQDNQFSAQSMKRSQGKTIASGNVELCTPEFSIEADYLEQQVNAQGKTLMAKGAPLKLYQADAGIAASVARLEYQSALLRLTFYKVTELVYQRDLNQQIAISADSIDYQFKTEQTSAEKSNIASSTKIVPSLMDIVGSPLRMTITQSNKPAITLMANATAFDFKTETLTLSGNVIIQQPQQAIYADTLIYRISDGSWEAPSNSQQRIKIVDTSQVQP